MTDEEDDSLLENDEPKYTFSVGDIADDGPLTEQEEIDSSLVDNTVQSEFDTPASTIARRAKSQYLDS